MEAEKKNKSQLLLTVLLIALALLAIVFFGLNINNEIAINKESKKKLDALQLEVDELKGKVAYQNERHERLLNDDEFVKRLIKQKFEYTDPKEIVFKFKEGSLQENPTPFVQ